jgi:hypothetical protein
VACNSQYKDIRDRIYGLFGVSIDHEEESFKLVPDYSKRPVEVYMDVFRKYFTPQIQGNFYDFESGSENESHFNKTIMKILKDPLWNNETKVFFSARDLGILNEVLQIRKTSGAIPIYATRRLVKVRPIISPATVHTSVRHGGYMLYKRKEGRVS